MDLTETNTTPPRGRRDRQSACRLLIVFAPEAQSVGQSMVLTKQAKLTLGRGESDGRHFCLRDSEVSRLHAEVEWQDEGWVVRDLGSRNGSYLDGLPLGEGRLEDASVLRLGSHVLLMQEVAMDDAVALIERAPEPASALVGESTATLRLRADIARLAQLPLPILVVGESGVGKEVVARELHRAFDRAGELVTVNCAALPEHLAESELFGHAKGAFTGADRASRGLFGRADGGTLFLDEIGEMPPPLQAKLLRALSTGEVRPVGEDKSWTPDVRVVAATNVDVEAAIEEGGFRGDLYARMMGASLRIPPLRERRADVLPLAREFLRRATGRDEITADAAEALLLDRWRFNVRELEQTIVVAAASGPLPLDIDALPPRFRARVEGRDAVDDDEGLGAPDLSLLEIRRDAVPDRPTLARVLAHYDGNISRTARFFGRSRRQIHRWVEAEGIELKGSPHT